MHALCKRNIRKLVTLFIYFVNAESQQFPFMLHKSAELRSNILIVVVDDWRHLSDKAVNLPNFNILAGKGIQFKNAFAQQARCAPSRNSMLTGRRPDSIRLYDFNSYWRTAAGNFTTIPQFFKEIGYQTYSAGKVFHPGISSNYTDDYPLSWSQIPFHPPSEKYKDARVCRDRKSKILQQNLICPVNVNEQPGRTLPDLETLDYALKVLKANRNESVPYFLAVGFHKPHIPLKFPKEYLDRVPLINIHGPKSPNIPEAMPEVAWQPWTDVRSRDDIHRLHLPFPYGTMPDHWTRKIKQSYYAASLYVDDLIGILMNYVDFDKTVVVLVSDHGWSLGENGLWAKYSNFDVALKVPLIIKCPGLKPKIIEEPVELIDLFPTLLDITNITNTIPKCKNNMDKTTLCFEGKSLLPLILQECKSCNNFTQDQEYVAISQYPRPSPYPKNNTDKPHLKDINIMGYSIRTSRYRYTTWVHFNPTLFTKNWTLNYGTELYDHKSDPYEANNLSNEPLYRNIIERLSHLLKSKVD